MKGEFTAIFKKVGKSYVAWVEEIPGANTQGKTLKEAKENLKEALILVLETNKMLSQKEGDGELIKEPFSIAI